MTIPGFASRTASIVLRKCSAPPSDRSSRATAVMTTCFSFIRRVASATRSGSSASSANGLAVFTAQKPQARVQRSPAIMNVAVPLLQHSQWFGHFALSHTVCRRKPSSRFRVRANVVSVGSFKRNHSGMRGRGFSAGSEIVVIQGFVVVQYSKLNQAAISDRFSGLGTRFQLLPRFLQLTSVKIRQHFTIDVNHRRKRLARQVNHLLVGSGIRNHVQLLKRNPSPIEPVFCLVAPATVRFHKQPNSFRFHTNILTLRGFHVPRKMPGASYSVKMVSLCS